MNKKLLLLLIAFAAANGAASEIIKWAPVIGRKDVTRDERPYSKIERDFKKVVTHGGALILHAPTVESGENALSLEIGSCRVETSLCALGIITYGRKEIVSPLSDTSESKVPGISKQQLQTLNRKIITLFLSKLKEKKSSDESILSDLHEVFTENGSTSNDMPASVKVDTGIIFSGILPYNDNLIQIKGLIERSEEPHIQDIEFSIWGRTLDSQVRQSRLNDTCIVWNPTQHNLNPLINRWFHEKIIFSHSIFNLRHSIRRRRFMVDMHWENCR